MSAVWDPLFWQRSALFDPIAPLAQQFSHHRHWPAFADYQRFIDAAATPITTQNGLPLRIVAQDSPASDDHYEARIFATGEAPTRAANWHDFFQVLMWRLYPRTKAMLNACHYAALQRRRHEQTAPGNRCAVENALTLFDECGVVVISDDTTLLNGIRQFAWKELFWHGRDRLSRHLRCIVFGHALYEKGLRPYLGMTGHAVLLDASPQLMASTADAQHATIDERLADGLADGRWGITPRAFAPFPLLGMPGWDPGNDAETYYDNHAYFRPARRRGGQPS